jgi:hypothetical protein
MKMFEYKVLEGVGEPALNRYGKEGWEIVAITRGWQNRPSLLLSEKP